MEDILRDKILKYGALKNTFIKQFNGKQKYAHYREPLLKLQTEINILIDRLLAVNPSAKYKKIVDCDNPPFKIPNTEDDQQPGASNSNLKLSDNVKVPTNLSNENNENNENNGANVSTITEPIENLINDNEGEEKPNQNIENNSNSSDNPDATSSESLTLVTENKSNTSSVNNLTRDNSENLIIEPLSEAINNVINNMTDLSAEEVEKRVLRHCSSIYKGEPELKRSFLDCLEILRSTINRPGNQALLVLLVKSRIGGDVRDWIENTNTIEEIINIINDRIQRVPIRELESKLKSLTFKGDKSKFASDIESISKSLEATYISNGMPLELARSQVVTKTIDVVKCAIPTEVGKNALLGNFNSVSDVLTRFRERSENHEAAINMAIVNRNKNNNHNNRNHNNNSNNRNNYRNRNANMNRNNQNHNQGRFQNYNNGGNNQYNNRRYNNNNNNNYNNNADRYQNHGQRGQNYNNYNNNNRNSNARNVRAINEPDTPDIPNSQPLGQARLFQN